MPGYSRAWSVTTPAGSVPAKNIDDEIRKLRVDIDERMADIVVDWTADPVVLRDLYSGKLTNRHLYVGFPEFNSEQDGGKSIYTQVDRIDAFTNSFPLVAMLRVPVGCTITLVELLTTISAGTSITWELRYNPFSGAASSVIKTVNYATAAKGISSTGAIAAAVDDAGYYTLSVEGNGAAGNGFAVYGARVTFNRPSVQEAT